MFDELEEPAAEEALGQAEEQIQEQPRAAAEIDIGQYVRPLQEKLDRLETQLDPERNARILHQQQAAARHQKTMADLRLAAEQGDYEGLSKHLPVMLSTLDQGMANLYQQHMQFEQFRARETERIQLENTAMQEERYFAARDPEGHQLVGEYPIAVARALAYSSGRSAPERADVEAAMKFMEDRFAQYGDNMQGALDEMANYVRMVKGASRTAPARRTPTAVPGASAPAYRQPSASSPIDILL
jgi:hypothetical protein